VKDEKCTGRDQREADALAPGQRFFQVNHRKGREHHQRNDFLHGLELRGGIHRAAEPVGRHRQAVFHQRQSPADEDHGQQRHFLVTQVPVPGGGHEDVRTDQQGDRREIGRQAGHGRIFAFSWTRGESGALGGGRL
jgi:hypothetical protein